jgi:hypothetical protein
MHRMLAKWWNNSRFVDHSQLRRLFSSVDQLHPPMRGCRIRLQIGCLFCLGASSVACSTLPVPTRAAESAEVSQLDNLPRAEDGISAVSPAGRIVCENLAADFVTDLDLRQTPSLTEPDPRSPFRDPEFSTCLIRVTDRQSDISPDDASLGLKNEYSRVQSFNTGGSKLIIRGTDGTWYLYDAFSLRPLEQLFLDSEPRWDASDPNLLHFSEETRLIAYDIRSGETLVVHEFAGDFPGQTLAAV